VRRKWGIAASICGLAAFAVFLALFRQPIFAHAGICCLVLATVLYLIPERGGGRSMVFPQGHPFFRHLVRLNFLASCPLSAVFVYMGLAVATGGGYGLLAVLAATRVLPDHALSYVVHRWKRNLLEATPPAGPFSGIVQSDLRKAVGYVHETRTHYRLWGETIYNVWLVDPLAGKLFLPSVTEIRGITEPLIEGAKLVAVGPIARALGITALQPVAYAVMPPGWNRGIAEWFDFLWRKCRRRRILRSAANSTLYLIAIAFLCWSVSSIGGGTTSMMAISLLSGLFLSVYSHKSLRESANYDISGYFEPRWHTLPGDAKERRLQHLRRLAESGQVSEEYVHLMETAADRP